MDTKNNIYFTSDQHFYHKNIIRFENRPFKNVEDMNEFMIKQWNSKVTNNDIIYHLGDFAFINKEKTKEIVSKLNGKKYIILGNHDRGRNIKYYYDCGFDKVYDTPILIKEYFILSHEPILYNSINCPYHNIFGHVHSNPSVYTYTPYSTCVCVERHNYLPVSLFQIVKSAKKLHDLIDLGKSDILNQYNGSIV